MIKKIPGGKILESSTPKVENKQVVASIIDKEVDEVLNEEGLKVDENIQEAEVPIVVKDELIIESEGTDIALDLDGKDVEVLDI